MDDSERPQLPAGQLSRFRVGRESKKREPAGAAEKQKIENLVLRKLRLKERLMADAIGTFSMKHTGNSYHKTADGCLVTNRILKEQPPVTALVLAP